MATSSELYLFYVTMTDNNTGKVTHTWMANSINAGRTCFNTPSWKDFRYYSKEQAQSIKKMLDALNKIRQKDGAITNYEYKIMSLKSAVNFHIKKMKELMEKRLPVTIQECYRTEVMLQNEIDRESKGIKEIPLHI